MNPRELLQVTDIDTITRKCHEILGDRVHTDGTHSLYNKGVIDGMEILLSAMSESMVNRKKIENGEVVSDK